MGYEADNGLYALVDLTKFYLASKSDSGKAILCSNLFETYSSPTFVQWDSLTLNTPYKAGITNCAEGLAFCSGNITGWHTVIAWTKGGNSGGSMWIHTYDNGKDCGWRKYLTEDSINARFMDMSSFTIAKIKSIYDTNMPIVGYVNYTSAIAPDKNTGFVFAAGQCAVFLSLSGSIYGLTFEDNWVKKN